VALPIVVRPLHWAEIVVRSLPGRLRRTECAGYIVARPKAAFKESR
jgi:hypothetical protein